MLSRFLTILCCSAAIVAQQTPPLRGQVVDEHGQPLADVAVCTFAEGERWTTTDLVKAAALRTDAQGRFELADAPATQLPHWDTVLLVAKGRLVMSVARDQIAFAPIVLAPGGVLAGRVLDAKGAPIAGARVQASDYLRQVVYVEQPPRRPDAAPVAAARTDARGAFVVTGACATAAWLEVDGDGLRDVSLGPVSAQDPLSIVLEPAPLLRGRVVDPENGGVGDLPVHMDRSDDWENTSRWTRTDSTGAFVFTWPGRAVSVSSTVTRGEQRWSARASVEDPAAECVLTLRLPKARPPAAARPSGNARKVQPEEIVSVRAVGPDGKPLAAFRASVHRIDRQQQQFRTEVDQVREFETASVAAVDGVAAASVCDGSGKDGLLVLVQAPGLAHACAQFAAGETAVEVKLEPAGAIAGKVVDARSGEPLAGVRVWSLASSERFRANRTVFGRTADSDPGLGVVTTDAAGAFRLEQVAGGGRLVFCLLPGHAERTPELVELAAGAERLDLRLELAPFVDVDGHLAGGPRPRTVGVRLAKPTPGSFSHSMETDYSSILAIDELGRFRATGLAPGKYEAQLVVLRPPRQGLPDKIPLAVVDIGFDTKTLELDVAATRPAQLTGRVTGPVPASRLAVVSSPTPTKNQFFAFLRYDGPIATLDPDGNFALEETPGARILVVIDVWTGAVLHREPPVTVAAGSERRVELAVEAVPVQVRVTGVGVGWHWLEIVPAREHWPGGVGQITHSVDHGYFVRMGARLEPGRTEGLLYLPAAPCTLRLRTAASRIQPPVNKDFLVQVELDPSQAKDRNVTIDVPPK